MEEFKLNAKIDPIDNRDFLFESSFQLELPNKVDHINEMTRVKNQGRLGSCVAFAVTAIKEWQESKEHQLEIENGKEDHRLGKEYDLSEQWLYYNCKKIDPWGESVEGTSIRYAMKVLQKIGVPCEKGWPYNSTQKGKPESWANMVAVWSLIESYQLVYGLDNIKKALINAPLASAIFCYEEINKVGNDGIIADPTENSRYTGAHAIALVGYDEEKQLFKFKNSWGTGWGENGYGYFSYNYSIKNLVNVWTMNDLSVTNEMLKGKKILNNL